jgi:hypothetical protein
MRGRGERAMKGRGERDDVLLSRERAVIGGDGRQWMEVDDDERRLWMMER